RAVQEAGYQASLLTTPKDEKKSVWSPLAGWQFNVVFGGAALLPLLVGEWVFNLGMERWFQWLAFALALPVQILCGARFYHGAWIQLRARSANMDTLVALGSSTAFLFSFWGLLARFPGHLYFMEGVGIISLVSLGHWLEARATIKASAA